MSKTIRLLLTALPMLLSLASCTSNEDNAGTKDDGTAKKALLIILDGWGIGDKGMGDVIARTIGAGRIVYQDLVKINHACADNSIMENTEIKAAYSYAKANGKNLHLMGLTSTGGIHSSLGHLMKLLDIAKEYDWIVVNFANADMVGHTGVYTAIEQAVKVIDQCLNEIVETAKKMGYETIITADHGNADHALNADGTPNTTHSVNPVPFIYVTENKGAKVRNGILADVAPSVIHIMGLQQPKEMTGKCLIIE